MVAANTFGRQIVVPLTNKSGGSVAAGDVVVIASANTDAFTTTTSAASTAIVGVAQETIANNATGRVCLGGYVPLVNVNASCTVLHYGTTHTVAKQATDAGTSRISGTCMVFLSTSATPDAYLYNPDLGGASLTNPMTTANDIIIGGASGVPARLATANSKYLGTSGAGVISWKDAVGALTSFTPTWTSDGTAVALGDGILTGRYQQLGPNTYFISIFFQAGSTSTYGTGNYSFALPAGLTSAAQVQILAGVVLDSGTRYYVATGYVDASATKVTWIVQTESGGAGRVGQTTPQTWAVGDQCILTGTIEVA